MTPSRMTVPLDVSSMRDGTIDTSSSTSSTGHLPAIDEHGNVIPDGSQSQRELRKEREDIDATYVMGAPALPPSFAPQERPKTQPAPNYTEPKPKKKGKTRAAIIVGIIAILVALGFAVHSIATSGSLFGFGMQDTTYWPSDGSFGDVPFGKRNGDDVKTPESGERQTETPKPTQKPSKAPNNTAYPTDRGQFLDRPAGQQGYGYYLHLTNKENVDRLVVKIQSSGG